MHVSNKLYKYTTCSCDVTDLCTYIMLLIHTYIHNLYRASSVFIFTATIIQVVYVNGNQYA